MRGVALGTPRGWGGWRSEARGEALLTARGRAGAAEAAGADDVAGAGGPAGAAAGAVLARGAGLAFAGAGLAFAGAGLAFAGAAFRVTGAGAFARGRAGARFAVAGFAEVGFAVAVAATGSAVAVARRLSLRRCGRARGSAPSTPAESPFAGEVGRLSLISHTCAVVISGVGSCAAVTYMSTA